MQPTKEDAELHEAVNKNDMEQVVRLIAMGHNPLSVDETGNSTLHIAATQGHIDMVKYFVERCKCPPTARNHEGKTLLHVACEGKRISNVALVEYLVSLNNEAPYEKDNDNNTAFHLAAMSGQLDILNYLIEKFELNCLKSGTCDCMRDKKCLGFRNRTLLHAACRNEQNAQVVKYLMKYHNSDLDVRDDDGNIPIHLSATNGDLETIKYLLEDYKCSQDHLTLQDKNGRNLLHFASCEEKNLSVVEYLCTKHSCSDPYLEDRQKSSAFHLAAYYGCLNIIKFLMERSPTKAKECRNMRGQSVLHYACMQNHLHVVRYLVEECGYDFTAKDNEGLSSMHLTARFGGVEVLKFLIEQKKCNPTEVDNWGRTPLHLACLRQDANVLEVVKYLTNQCPDLSKCKDKLNILPIDLANHCYSRNEVVKYLESEMRIKWDPREHVSTRNIFDQSNYLFFQQVVPPGSAQYCNPKTHCWEFVNHDTSIPVIKSLLQCMQWAHK